MSPPEVLSRWLVRALLVAVGAALVFSHSSPAQAQTNYPLEATIVVRDANGKVITAADGIVVGQPLTVTANGWFPGTSVALSFVCDDGGVFQLGASNAGATGEVVQAFKVPVGAIGFCSLRLDGTGSNGNPRSVEAALRVVTTAVAGAAVGADGGTAPGAAANLGAAADARPLAKTGVDVWGLVAIGLSAIAVGLALALAMRRSSSRKALASP